MSEELYDQLKITLEENNSSILPSEVQGALCGMLSMSRRLDVDAWMEFILERSEIDSDPALNSELIEVQNLTELGFDAVSGGMTLLLPSDEVPLPERLEALSAWCEGFLYGVGISGPKFPARKKPLPETAEEFLSDIRKISHLDPECEDEDAEHYYMELVEYIRVGVVVFREEMLPGVIMAAQDPKTSQTRH